jgi:hypothetical protein
MNSSASEFSSPEGTNERILEIEQNVLGINYTMAEEVTEIDGSYCDEGWSEVKTTKEKRKATRTPDDANTQKKVYQMADTTNPLTHGEPGSVNPPSPSSSSITNGVDHTNSRAENSNSMVRPNSPEHGENAVFLILTNFSNAYNNDKKMSDALRELKHEIDFIEMKKLRNNNIGITVPNTKVACTILNKDYDRLKIFSDNPNMQVKMPAPRDTSGKVIRNQSFPVVIKYIDYENDELKSLLDKQDLECTKVTDLENRRLSQKTDHKLAYLKSETDRENLINFGLHINYISYRCEVPRFTRFTLQCGKCLKFGHKRQDCRNDIVCKRCGSNQHLIKDCVISRQDAVCNNCKGNHRATYLLPFPCRSHKEQSQTGTKETH